MRFGYKSEVAAVCTAIAAVVCFAFLPLKWRVAAVPVWLAVQRLVARGSRNRATPPQKKGARDDSQNGDADVSPRESRPTFVMSRGMADAERPVAVVTGTNSGIGYHTAVGLAVEGYRVVCTCRNAALSAETAAKIQKEAEDRRRKRLGDPKYAEVPEVVLVDGRFCLECDNFESIRLFVKQFQAAYTRLDVLVNNAGLVRKRLEFSQYNPQLELHTAVNFLGPLLLTELLVPLIQKSQGRVVYVSSAAHRFPQLALRTGFFWKSSDTCLNGRLLKALKELNQGASDSTGPLNTASFFYAFARYGTSKLLNIYHAHHIARHHKVPVCSLHPGCVVTNVLRDLVSRKWIDFLFHCLAPLFLKFWEEGAQTTLHCAMCDVDELKPVAPPGDAQQKALVSPFFVECRNQTLEDLWLYGWDVEEADRIVNWGRRLVGLVSKED